MKLVEGVEFVNFVIVFSLIFGILFLLLIVYVFIINWEFVMWENEGLYKVKLNKWWIIDLVDLIVFICK